MIVASVMKELSELIDLNSPRYHQKTLNSLMILGGKKLIKSDSLILLVPGAH